ncbi:MAG TPA: J domain-containing protein [Brevundimonas sp.]|uniref:J domain-containing protein n=1 Tax=Brevundimonas sp. TaxID=1871086 RepID=UPI002CEE38F8|nr:J domain-containing protein [Brevundimonas sp.]HRH19453.1 J domain-containing protein [Brevundimonas sp.]
MAGDPYKELGVPRSATKAEIKKAFHRLAKDLHPDRNPGDKAAEERFKRVTAAFDLLGDEEKRAKFDRGEIDADGREQFRGGFGGRGPGAAGGSGRFEGADLDDIFEMFGGMGGRARGPARGQDIRARMEISLEESIAGGTRRIAFSDGRTLDVNIPKGAAEGQVLRLKDQGAPGRQGGPSGDALIEIVVAEHPIYRREGADLHMDAPVSAPDAILGGKVTIQTPDGAVKLKIDKGSNSGQVMRLKGRGAFDARTGKRGDLMARLMVMLPRTIDPDLEQFAEAWREQRPYSPTAR